MCGHSFGGSTVLVMSQNFRDSCVSDRCHNCDFIARFCRATLSRLTPPHQLRGLGTGECCKLPSGILPGRKRLAHFQARRRHLLDAILSQEQLICSGQFWTFSHYYKLKSTFLCVTFLPEILGVFKHSKHPAPVTALLVHQYPSTKPQQSG